MSKFLSKKYDNLEPYVPGEQPKDKKYIKLNTNESPYSVPEGAYKFLNECRPCHLYCDSVCDELTNKYSEMFNIDKKNIIFGNGSDEILYFSFLAWCDKNTPALFADITYGFYEVYANFINAPYSISKLKSDFTINIDDFKNSNKTIFIANPNAWTGISLDLASIEEIVKSNLNNVVVIDEAYVDFGGESAVPLTKKYDNVFVIQTFSKSRSLAGARLGYGIGSEKLIQDLNTIKFSINPYNVNSMTQSLALGVLHNEDIIQENISNIISNREYLVSQLQNMDFEILPSKANFIMAKNNKISGENLYKKLKENGILVRYSNADRVSDFIRITIGSINQMEAVVEAIKKIIKEL